MGTVRVGDLRLALCLVGGGDFYPQRAGPAARARVRVHAPHLDRDQRLVLRVAANLVVCPVAGRDTRRLASGSPVKGWSLHHRGLNEARGPSTPLWPDFCAVQGCVAARIRSSARILMAALARRRARLRRWLASTTSRMRARLAGTVHRRASAAAYGTTGRVRPGLTTAKAYAAPDATACSSCRRTSFGVPDAVERTPRLVGTACGGRSAAARLTGAGTPPPRRRKLYASRTRCRALGVRGTGAAVCGLGVRRRRHRLRYALR